MKHIANLIDLNRVKSEKYSAKDDEISEETAHVVNLLFRELKAIFPAFRQAWPTDDDFNRAKLNWVKAFKSAGINKIEKLKLGVEKCRMSESPFAPSVGRFISWCNPSAEDIGFPGFEESYRISIRINQQFSEYKHPDDRIQSVIKHAISQLGTMVYRSMPEEKAKVAFKTNYDISIKQFLDGELKIIPKSISERPQPHPSDKQRSDEARLKCMEELRSKGIAIGRRMQINTI